MGVDIPKDMELYMLEVICSLSVFTGVTSYRCMFTVTVFEWTSFGFCIMLSEISNTYSSVNTHGQPDLGMSAAAVSLCLLVSCHTVMLCGM
jgi:hypothetical protein